MTEEKINVDDKQEEQDTEEQVDKAEDKQEATVTVAELKRRIAKVEETKQQEIEKLKEETNKAIESAVETAKKEASLSGKELAEYQEKERQRKHQEEIEERDKKIQELLQDSKRREIRDESIKKLNELEISVNDDSLSLIQADSFDEMKAKAEMLSKLVKESKNNNARSTPPITSGGKVSKTYESEFDILDKHKITKY